MEVYEPITSYCQFQFSPQAGSWARYPYPPLKRRGSGLSLQRPPFGVLTATVSSLERTPIGVFPPEGEGHDKPLWRMVPDGGLFEALLRYKGLKRFRGLGPVGRLTVPRPKGRGFHEENSSPLSFLQKLTHRHAYSCLLYTSPSPRDS